jgi:Sap, sulfolipid-1-addressing protein
MANLVFEDLYWILYRPQRTCRHFGIRKRPLKTALAVAAAAAIAGTGIGGGEQAVAYLVVALIATVGVAAPVVIYFAMVDRARPLLNRLKQWIGRNNAVIMAVLLLVIGAFCNLSDDAALRRPRARRRVADGCASRPLCIRHF